MVIRLRYKPLHVLLSLTVLLGVRSHNCLAQTDSVKQLFESKPERMHSAVYADLVTYFAYNNPDSAYHYANLGLANARKFERDTGLSSIYNRLGIALDVNGQPDSALKCYERAIFYSKRAGIIINEAGAWNNIGLIHWNQGDWELAIEKYLESARLFEQVDHPKGLGNTFNNIGLILWEEKRFNEALPYFRRAKNSFLVAKDAYGLGATYLNFALVYDDLNRRDSSLVYLRKAIAKEKSVNDLYGLAKAYNNIGILFDRKDAHFNLDSAAYYYRKSLVLQRKLNNHYATASSQNNLALVLMKKNEFETSRLLLDSALSLAKENDLKKLLSEIYWNTALWFHKTGKDDSVFHYASQFQELQDSVFTEERSRALAELEIRYKTEKNKAEIARLAQAEAEASLEINKQRNWIIFLIIGLFCVVFTAWFVYDRRARKNRMELAEREAGYRKQLLDSTVMAQEEERQRVAKDLHDGIVQTLAAVKMGLESSTRQAEMSPALQEGLLKHIQVVNDAIEEARTLSHQMMPRTLMEAGLLPAMDDMLERTFKDSPVVCHFEHFGFDHQRLENRIEVSLYRIAQEMVNNILKHSGADQVNVQLMKTADQVVLHVEDNGRGFTAHEAGNRRGIGLNNIYSRASSINGNVSFDAGHPSGTIAHIRVPLTVG